MRVGMFLGEASEQLEEHVSKFFCELLTVGIYISKRIRLIGGKFLTGMLAVFFGV